MEREPAAATGAELIAAERERQVAVEGWTADHDDGHALEEMAVAAAIYALPKQTRVRIPGLLGSWRHGAMYEDVWRDGLWPWPGEFKPTNDRVSELTKAGALIAAEIDRLQRADMPEPSRDPAAATELKSTPTEPSGRGNVPT